MTALRDSGFVIPRAVLDASGASPDVTGDTPVFAFVLRLGPACWLVDAGAGPCLGDRAGRLPEALAHAGLAPGRVSRVLLTHLHPDHVGGLSDAEGRPRFPGAEVVVSRREWEDWLSPRARAGHDADAAEVAAGAARALGGYRLSLLDGMADLGRGATAIPAPGHRAGHMAYRLGGPGGALFVGDALHLPSWQLADPGRGLVWDADPEAARATRRCLLGLAADERLLVGGAHWGPEGLARVAREGSGFRALPAG